MPLKVVFSVIFLMQGCAALRKEQMGGGESMEVDDTKASDGDTLDATVEANSSVTGCCKWGRHCADCGTDDTGWCHESGPNCRYCTGSYDPGGHGPTHCRRRSEHRRRVGVAQPPPSRPSPTPAPTPHRPYHTLKDEGTLLDRLKKMWSDVPVLGWMIKNMR
eukprot:TRINITY_DN6766_c0_g1_i2.p1 TRINITY_DN6766_c0_g1~~TRINITY_DN6766_c0_g1_i2.p1  ORF type:complete len:182 (+),score=20.54 TRINITY_DN6766_c0_g1_i2:63-548(+)